MVIFVVVVVVMMTMIMLWDLLLESAAVDSSRNGVGDQGWRSTVNEKGV